MASKKVAVRRVYVTKAKKRRRSRFTLPIAVAIPVALSGLKAYSVYESTGSLYSAGRNLFAYYTGYGTGTIPKFEPAYWRYGLMPLALGLLVHKLAGKFGVNSAIARAKIPVVRI